jgi:hypothetical protein
MPVSTIQNASLASGVPSTAKMPAGSVLQVVQNAYATTTSSTSGTFASSGLSASITPTSSTSKILILVSVAVYISRAGNDAGAKLQLVRGGTALITQSGASLYIFGGGSAAENITQPFMQYLDSPATTSSTTYALNFATNGIGTVSIQYNNNSAYMTLMEIAA